MFMTKSAIGEKQIYQDVRLNLASKMQGYTAIEKAGMMGLQTLVGFSRYKENLKNSDYEIGENGEKIYCQKISTVTHGINLKTLQMIEKLGYIKIDSEEEEFKQNPINKILGKSPKGMEKLLIMEKLGFRNYSDLKKIAIAGITGDKQTLNSMKKTFKKITFRLTDKPIDFEQLYTKTMNLDKIEDKNERIALKRLAAIFDNKQGILATKNIGIEKDSFGRDIIKYNTPEPFGNTVERKLKNQQLKNNDFRDSLKENVDIVKVQNNKIQTNEIKKDKSMEI